MQDAGAPTHKQPGVVGPSDEEIAAKWTSLFVEYAGLSHEDRILDIGCGPGRMASAIGERFGWRNAYHGFDIRGKVIRECRESITAKHPAFTFSRLRVGNSLYVPIEEKASLARFPSDSHSVDFALATSVFTHMEDEVVAHYIRETHRVLKGRGRFFSTWFIIDEVTTQAIAAGKARFEFRHRKDDGRYINDLTNENKAVAFDHARAEQLLRDAGFVDIAFYRGEWGGATKARHSQDIFVARKAPARWPFKILRHLARLAPGTGIVAGLRRRIGERKGFRLTRIRLRASLES